ncbi:MAG: 3-oxoacid CoA-transferase subunit A [Candidatus Tectomicrobia bacterium]|nr:3-oxoacid CoA-transferase subunit A [Candidatus Tectomicrobia bacterium]
MNKIYPSADEAVKDVPDGAVIMFGGFGTTGEPEHLIRALARQGAKHLTAISNAAGAWERNLAPLFKNRQIQKFIGSFPAPKKAHYFEGQVRAGEVEYECVPQGTLIERIRAGGAGIGAFYTPTAVGTPLAEGKETRVIGGREQVLERALYADYAFVKAYKGDRWGNLVYRMTARNFNPVMATAARVTIAEVEEIDEVGELDPETVVTPAIFVNRVVRGEHYDKSWVDE